MAVGVAPDDSGAEWQVELLEEEPEAGAALGDHCYGALCTYGAKTHPAGSVALESTAAEMPRNHLDTFGRAAGVHRRGRCPPQVHFL